MQKAQDGAPTTGFGRSGWPLCASLFGLSSCTQASQVDVNVSLWAGGLACLYTYLCMTSLVCARVKIDKLDFPGFLASQLMLAIAHCRPTLQYRTYDIHLHGQGQHES